MGLFVYWFVLVLVLFLLQRLLPFLSMFWPFRSFACLFVCSFARSFVRLFVCSFKVCFLRLFVCGVCLFDLFVLVVCSSVGLFA